MFANPLWSVLLLFVPLAIYWFIIRPRLKVESAIAWTELYDHVDGFWRRQWARIYAFRSFLIATLGVVLVAAPDILVAISSLDLSFLPQPWPMWVSFGVSTALTLIRAFATTPGEEPHA